MPRHRLCGQNLLHQPLQRHSSPTYVVTLQNTAASRPAVCQHTTRQQQPSHSRPLASQHRIFNAFGSCVWTCRRTPRHRQSPAPIGSTFRPVTRQGRGMWCQRATPRVPRSRPQCLLTLGLCRGLPLRVPPTLPGRKSPNGAAQPQPARAELHQEGPTKTATTPVHFKSMALNSRRVMWITGRTLPLTGSAGPAVVSPARVQILRL